ncbi:LamG domain-containing protein [Pseudomonadota bacterium]
MPTETVVNTPAQAGDSAKPYDGEKSTSLKATEYLNTTLWENLVERCGGCHGKDGQPPAFADQSNINSAYSQVITVVNLSRPQESRLVTKVGTGHNCWDASANACAVAMTADIKNWVTQDSDTLGRQVTLVAPESNDVGSSKRFPNDSVLFSTTLYPILRDNCAECHSESAPIPQAPYFSSSDVDAAYEAIKASQKIDLDTPSNSRVVVRVRDEFHNCWEGSASLTCQDNADAIQAGIVDLANGSVTDQVDAQLVISKALKLSDGIVASGGSRHEEDVIALYEFKTGEGNVIYDSSGVEPSLHLQLSGLDEVDYRWVGGWGLEFVDSKAQGTTAASKKLYDFVRATGEYSIEAWVVPANVTQEGPARIITYSAGTDERNFTLGQTLYNYEFMHRSSTTDGNGDPSLSTADADEDLQASEQHVVATFDAINGRRLYVNGVFTDDLDPEASGSLADWDDTFAFVLGDEVTNNRTWQGKIRLVAIHKRALTQEQISRNFDVGVGERFFLLFNVGAAEGVPEGSYVMFEVAQFDSYSYLFTRPTFISLDMTATVGSIPIRAMRIGINGKEALVGQAYRNLDVTVTDSQFLPSTNFNAKSQVLSELGTIISLEKGAELDEFFLSFELLGSDINVVVEAQPSEPAAPADADPSSEIGLRDFAEVYRSMAEVTGVSPVQADVLATYETIKQQLPATYGIETFSSSHQVAISQLAIEYCSALVNDVSLRSAFFPGFNFSVNASVALDEVAERDLVLNPLIDQFMGTNLASQPTAASVRLELDNLVAILTSCGGSCPAGRTETVVKSSCAAVLGSATTLLQ